MFVTDFVLKGFFFFYLDLVRMQVFLMSSLQSPDEVTGKNYPPKKTEPPRYPDCGADAVSDPNLPPSDSKFQEKKQTNLKYCARDKNL